MAAKEPYKPWMRSLLNRMKELYNKPDAKTIGEALPEIGSGGEVTPASIVTATGNMTAEQAAQMLSNIGAEPEFFVCTFTDLSTCDKTFYQAKAAHDAGKIVLFVYKDSCNIAQYYNDGGSDTLAAHLTWGATSIYGVALYLVDGVGVIGVEKKLQTAPTSNTISGDTPTITPAKNNIYNCGTLTSLTISNPPATGSYSIVFTSGATPTTTSIPATILGLEDFSAEANTIYEINVLDNRAVVGSWAVSA